MKKLNQIVSMAIVVIALAACSSGGGGGDDPNPIISLGTMKGSGLYKISWSIIDIDVYELLSNGTADSEYYIADVDHDTKYTSGTDIRISRKDYGSHYLAYTVTGAKATALANSEYVDAYLVGFPTKNGIGADTGSMFMQLSTTIRWRTSDGTIIPFSGDSDNTLAFDFTTKTLSRTWLSGTATYQY